MSIEIAVGEVQHLHLKKTDHSQQEELDLIALQKFNRNREKLIQICLFLSGLSVAVQLYLFQPLLPQLSKSFSISPSTSSLTVSFSTFGIGTGLFAAMFFADRFSRKKVMVYSLLTSSLLTIFSVVSIHFEMIVLICFIRGLLISGVSAVALAYIREEVHPASLALTIGLYLAGNTVGGMGGRLIASFPTTWVSWQTCIVLMGMISLFIGLVFAWLLPPSKKIVVSHQTISEQYSRIKYFLMQKSLLKIYCTGMLLVGIFVSVYNYLGFRLESSLFSLPHYVISFVFLTYITGVIGSIVAGTIGHAYTSEKLIKGFIVMLGIGLCLLLSSSIVLVITGLGIVTFSFFGAHTVANSMVSYKVKTGTSTATSLYGLIYYVGSSLIGSASGNVISMLNWTFFIYTLLALACISLLVSISMKRE